MSEAKVYAVETRLGREAGRPGGLSMSELVAAAERGLERARDGVEAAVRKNVEELVAMAADRSAEAASVYACAARLVDVTGLYGARPLHSAAQSLCDLCDGESAPDWPAVTVHVRALKLFSDADGVEGQAGPVLEGLRKVVEAARMRRARSINNGDITV